MSEPVYETVNGVSRRYTVYTPEEIRSEWDSAFDPRNRKARQRGRECVVVRCSEAQAYEYVAQFLRLSACPPCTHYDGRTLSMYCGGVGSDAVHLFRDVARMVASVNS